MLLLMMCGRMVTIANAVCLGISVSQSDLDRGESVTILLPMPCGSHMSWQPIGAYIEDKLNEEGLLYEESVEHRDVCMRNVSQFLSHIYL